jgi:hypothetical protein
MEPSDHSKVIIRKILFTRFLTRTGDHAWDFAVPVSLIYLLPNKLNLVALVYLLSKAGSAVLQPWVIGVIDKWPRISSILLATCSQLVGIACVVLSLFSISIQVQSSSLFSNLLAVLIPLAGIVFGTILSNLGSSLMEISIGYDWVPDLIPPQTMDHYSGFMHLQHGTFFRLRQNFFF